ncbi:phosphatidate cytidylyltransferase [Leuconostocaceae bacterium ESL0958]|nr:phosphatidate cytidylyltransferase [Leuconostocaceae bacterium ESL0958]
MKTRIITAVVALAVFIPILLIGHTPLLLLTVLLGLIAMGEILRMTHSLLVSFEALIAYVGVTALILPNSFWNFQVWKFHITSQNIVYTIAFLLLLRTVFSRSHFNFQDAGTLFIAMVYIGTGFHYFYMADQKGLAFLFYGMLLVWITDSMAYFCGRAFGQHKLAPTISPNKTWEGSLGGTILAVIIVAGLYIATGWLSESKLSIIICAILLSVGGQIGDLIESSLKRHFQVKDSGKILPGHGGILDRFDSMLVVMPMMAILGLLY